MMTWVKLFPSGAWQVRDDRLPIKIAPMGRMTYFGYTLREAKAAHAHVIREARRGTRKSDR
jgi:hypothetical protein